MIFRMISGAVGLILLTAAVLLAQDLLAREYDATVLLAGYAGIGCILVGAYFLFFAITGKWRPSRKTGKKTP